jgi:TolB-like protein/tetratricopeptide (TPR) repeat protein
VQWSRLPGGEASPGFVQRVAQLLDLPDQPPASVGIHPAAPKVSARPAIATAASARTAASGKHGRRALAPALLVAALALCAAVAAWFWHAGRSRTPGMRPPNAANANPAAGMGPVTVPIQAKSVAVLPFADMSEGHDQEYLADGMAEEIIERLIKVPELRVPARTSSFYFKGKNARISDIARELSVANILEGTVRKSGNRLRISTQLVRADSGLPLWSETFDRQMADVFRVQDEIASATATALQIALGGGPLTREEGGTRNLQAYQLYLRGMSDMNGNSATSVRQARESFEQAIRVDPDYGLAWAGLAFAWADMADQGLVGPLEGYERDRKAALRAIELSPRLATGHVTLAYVYRTLDWNWQAATEEVERALAISPANSEALYLRGLVAQTLGQWDEADRWLRASVSSDPLSTFAIFNYANALYLAGRLGAAEAQLRRLLQVAPHYEWTRAWLAKTLLAAGKPAEALAILAPDHANDSDLLYLGVILLANGRTAEADLANQRLEREQGNVSAFYVAQYYAYKNDRERALQWLERAVAQKDTGLVDILGEPLLKNIEGEPRYRAVLRQMNLPGS